MKKYRWYFIILLISLLLISASITYFAQVVASDVIQAKTTAEAEVSLTTAQRAEVTAAISNYEENWLSLEAHKNPSIQSELATGGYLGYWGYARAGDKVYDEPFWLITKSAKVTYLRVIEYTPKYFKAIAVVEHLTDEIKPTEEFIQSLSKQEYCSFYLFVQEDATWKVADMFDMTFDHDIERDWEYHLLWSKKILGEQRLESLPLEKCPNHKQKMMEKFIATITAAQHRVHLTGGILRHFQAFFSLQHFPL